jgi:hypothetical protein
MSWGRIRRRTICTSDYGDEAPRRGRQHGEAVVDAIGVDLLDFWGTHGDDSFWRDVSRVVALGSETGEPYILAPRYTYLSHSGFLIADFQLQ